LWWVSLGGCRHGFHLRLSAWVLVVGMVVGIVIMVVVASQCCGGFVWWWLGFFIWCCGWVCLAMVVAGQGLLGDGGS